MPLTFPSHAAAVLPLYRRWPRLFDRTALVVGSTAPDLAYLLYLDGRFTHSAEGVLLFCVPTGLLVLVLLELLVVPLIATGLPWPRFRALVQDLSTPSPRPLSGWLQVLFGLFVGVLTHDLWDGFTHTTRWPAVVLYRGARLFDGGPPVATVLQHLSTVVGLVIMTRWCLGRLRRTTPMAAPAVERRAEIGLAMCLVGALAGLFVAALLTPRWNFFNAWWRLIWCVFRGAAVGLVAGGLYARSPKAFASKNAGDANAA